MAEYLRYYRITTCSTSREGYYLKQPPESLLHPLATSAINQAHKLFTLCSISNTAATEVHDFTSLVRSFHRHYTLLLSSIVAHHVRTVCRGCTLAHFFLEFPFGAWIPRSKHVAEAAFPPAAATTTPLEFVLLRFPRHGLSCCILIVELSLCAPLKTPHSLLLYPRCSCMFTSEMRCPASQLQPARLTRIFTD